MKLYTKLGDDGSTSLYGGRRVMKDDIRIEVSGEIDEFNAHIGLLSTMVDNDVTELLDEIQARLFIVGATISSSGIEGSWRVGKEVHGMSCLKISMMAFYRWRICRASSRNILSDSIPQKQKASGKNTPKAIIRWTLTTVCST